MELDATRPAMEETIETDTCILGAGVAGLVVAAELAAAGRDVVVLESGGAVGHLGDGSRVRGFDLPPAGGATLGEDALSLSDGDVVGDPYAGLRATRSRGIGGTTSLWNTPTPGGLGAKYTPLDPWDFEPRWPEAPGGWPFDAAALQPHYERAQRICGLPEGGYGAGPWTDAPRAPLPLGGGVLTSRVYHMGSRAALLDPLLAALRRATNVRLVSGATAVKVVPGEGRRPVATVTVASLADGRRWQVRAKRVVLAAGAVENARLLLLAAEVERAIEDRSGWLGRGFMEHPRDRTIQLRCERRRGAYEAVAFYDTRATGAATAVVGRLALAESLARSPELLNASVTLLPRLEPLADRARQMLRAAGRSPLGRRWLPAGGHGWSGHPAPHLVHDGFVALLNVEQPPRHENAVRLSARRDALGVPLPELHWRWHPDDHARLLRLRAVVARALAEEGVGEVTLGPDVPPDPNAHHHAGTTRLHSDPRLGVADAEGRVHGTETLFVTGASTFPTAGWANPVLTIVAMAARLAGHLARL